MIYSGAGTRLPKLSYLLRDDLLEAVLGYFTERTGVRVWFQDVSGYTIAPETEVPAYCGMLINLGRCGLTNPAVPMPADQLLPQFRVCIGGIGHLIIPITLNSGGGSATEIGRLITEPMATRPTRFEEVFSEAERLHVHPDNLSSAGAQIPVVDIRELQQLAAILGLVIGRIATENATRARTLAVTEAFEKVGMGGTSEIVDEALSGIVTEFTGADAAILSTASGADAPEHKPSFRPGVDEHGQRLTLQFTSEVIRWIAQTGYPISFPDLGGSAWCRHVTGDAGLEGALASIPVKLPGEARGWWTVYYQRPVANMEDHLHRLSVLAAHTAQTLTFMTRLEATQQAAMTDSLTGLHNRRYLRDQLERELSRAVRGRYPVSLIILDIDNFKQINDTHGHVAGDEALKHVADVLRLPLRRSSTICRYGGDEFCVVVPESGKAEAERVAQRLSSELQQSPLVFNGLQIPLRISGGVATQEADAPPGTDLFALADRELIRAKREGKDRIKAT